MVTKFYEAGCYARSESLGWLLKRVVAAISFQADQRLPHGLTHAQWAPLLMLHLGGPSSVVKLVAELDTDAGAMTRLLDRLETKGLCQRERSSDDRRVVMLSLTPEGQRLTSELTTVLADTFNDLLDGFSKDEWLMLLSLLKRMLANAEALRVKAAARTESTPSPEA